MCFSPPLTPVVMGTVQGGSPPLTPTGLSPRYPDGLELCGPNVEPEKLETMVAEKNIVELINQMIADAEDPQSAVVSELRRFRVIPKEQWPGEWFHAVDRSRPK